MEERIGFTVNIGDIVGLLGDNGCGCWTLGLAWGLKLLY
jgi:ABC-type oligopeptide transport system ATPase subunit